MSFPRCGTCRWFGDADEDKPAAPDTTTGVCRFIIDVKGYKRLHNDDDSDRPHSELACPADAENYSAWLYVDRDFGCVEHSPKAEA